MKKHKIFLNSPAIQWEAAYPAGCGKMGSMVYGDPHTERWQLNEERIWSNGKVSAAPENYLERFLHVRELLKQGKAVEADAWAKENMMDVFTNVDNYETAGEVFLDLPEGDVGMYQRQLELEDGIATTTYRKRGIAINARYHEAVFTHESFGSYPDQLLVMRVSCGSKFACGIRYTRNNRPDPLYSKDKVDSGTVNLTSRVYTKDGIRAQGVTACGKHTFTVAIKLQTDGEVTALEDKLQVTGASHITLYTAIRTDGEPTFPAKLDYEDIKARHIADMNAIMGRSIIEFPEDPLLEAIPTDGRLARIRAGGDDPGMVETYFAFNNYLLISSSRGDSLPANLQGIWNDTIQPPWQCDYHLNINLQMNYWHAETAGLTECLEPLFNYMNQNLLESGKRTAREYYHLEGSVSHLLSDIYGYTQVASSFCGMWQYGSAWLCRHMKEHWLYTGDRDFLENTAYEFVRETTRFLLGMMFEHNGMLLTGPSNSPENRYFTAGPGSPEAKFCLSPTMDVQIIHELLSFYVEVEALLNRDPELARRAKEALPKLPPMKVGKHGQLMEWMEDYDEPEVIHRHLSHLYALYPAWDINEDTPELLEACRVTMKRRMGDEIKPYMCGGIGWSCAWAMNIYARLADGEQAYNMLTRILSLFTKESLLNNYTPMRRIIQIESNFGTAAGIMEMLLQSHRGCVKILPALPQALAEGSFTGLKARGGLTVSADWKDGKVTKLILQAKHDAAFMLAVNGQEMELSMKAGEERQII